MNTKERLIEEIKKDNWFVHTYNDKNRAYCFLSLLTNLDKEWLFSLNPYHFLPKKLYLYSRSEYDKVKETNCPSLDGIHLSDLTQMFNEYLEECNPGVWMHSVLAARELKMKVEIKDENKNEWYNLDKYSCLSSHLKYRIEHKAEKLVPDEVWELFEDEFKYIAKDEDGRIIIHNKKPEIRPVFLYWWSKGDIYTSLNNLKIMKNAKIHDVDWEDSLCIRPPKR